MAYKMSDVGGWGTGALGDITNPAGQVNSYANVTAISTNTVTIGTASNGIYETFVVGKEILLHVSAVLSGTDAAKLGKYLVATITGVSGSVLTLSKDVAANLVANADLSTLVVQAITVAQFGTLTLSSGSITPPVYTTTTKYGGVIALKCKTELIFSGGSISLVDKGIPTASSAMRPLTAQETEMATSGKSTGWENHITSRQALLNCGNGAALLWAKKTTISSTSSRIGGTTAGVAYYPYAVVDNDPAEALGGSAILLASETIVGFAVSLISKGKGTGTGYGRCYIATDTRLPNDEGLYAQDCLSNPARLRDLGLTNFGGGVLGDIANPSGQINSYAAITSISGKNVTIGITSTGAYGSFSVGSKVVIHLSAMQSAADSSMFGRFFVSTVLGVNGSTIVLADELPFTVPMNAYYCQLISMPCFNNLTLDSGVISPVSWNNTSKYGGVLTIAVNGTLTIGADGGINLAGKGLPSDATLRPFLAHQCSGQQKNYLPISQGHGAALIVAKNLVFSSTTKRWWISGNTFYGSNGALQEFAGVTGNYLAGSYSSGGGYAGGGYGYGVYASSTAAIGGGPWNPAPVNGEWSAEWAASGGRTGENGRTNMGNPVDNYIGKGGASLFIVADTITGFRIAALDTGGGNGNGGRGAGSCGYGGGGALVNSNYLYNGGGPGTCFIYANNITNPDYTGVVI